jgi:alpha-beta hydrolase superfamily lysophospholipase
VSSYLSGNVAINVFFGITGVVFIGSVVAGIRHLLNLSSEQPSLRRLQKNEITKALPLVSARFFLSEATGLLVHHRTWNPPSNVTPVAAIYMLHGYGEYCGQFDPVANKLASFGFIVHALDHQGHGLSEGDRGYMKKLAELSNDVFQLVMKVSPHRNEMPCFLLGHSLGSLIALITVEDSPEDLWSGLILSAPGLVLDPKVDNPTTRSIMAALSHWFPKLEFEPLDPAKMSNEPEIVLHYSRDPLLYRGVRARLVHEVLETVPKAIANAKHLKMPVLLLHGEKDAICNPESSKLLMKELTVEDKTLKMYPNLLHEVFNEAIGMSIVDEVGEWISERSKGLHERSST